MLTLMSFKPDPYDDAQVINVHAEYFNGETFNSGFRYLYLEPSTDRHFVWNVKTRQYLNDEQEALVRALIANKMQNRFRGLYTS